MSGKNKGLVVVELLLFIFGTLITIMIFVGVIWPWITGIWYGECWAESRMEVRKLGHELEGGIKTPDSNPTDEVRLNLGPCIAGMLFLNGKDNPDALPNVDNILDAECESYDGYKSYMLLIPQEYVRAINDPEYEKEFGKDTMDKIKDTFSYWQRIKNWVADKFGKVPDPYCYELKHDFSSGSIKALPAGFFTKEWAKPENWNPGTDPYCVRAKGAGSGSDYLYEIYEVTCSPTELMKDTGMNVDTN
jgi:hypothetical protein